MSRSMNSESVKMKLAEILKFVKILRVEPFMFLMIFQYGLKGMPNFQMIQDKICMQWYNTSFEYCRDLPTIHEEDSDPGHYKTRILADSIQMASYITYVELFPSLIWGLFIGAWIDRFTSGRKWLLVIYCFASMVENLILIVLTIIFNRTSPYINVFITVPTLLLVGGGTGPRISVTHYMTTTTPPKMMSVRFMLFEICLTLALPIGSALAGFIIANNPLFETGQTRNYSLIYIVSFAVDIIGLLWVIFMVNESIALKQQNIVEKELQEEIENENPETTLQLTTSSSDKDKNIHPLKLLFSLDNVMSMIRVVVRKRPNKGRVQIILVILALAIIFGEQIALTSLNNQFIQRVYLWSPDYTAYMSAIGMFVASITTMTTIPLMTRVFMFWDVSLAIIGYFINLTTNLIKGLWLSTNAFFVTMAIGAIGGMASICTRAHIAKIVDRNEQGKMMGVITMMDTVSPVIATTIFSQIFRQTVESQPGTIYQVIAGIIVIPISFMTWIYFFTERQIIDGVNNQQIVDGKKNNGDSER